MNLTQYASAERSDREALEAAREAFLANNLAVAMLHGIPDYAVVINHCRQIIAANTSFLHALGLERMDPLLGVRPGESVGCIYADAAPGGCGTSGFCIHCGGVDAMVECLRTHQPVTRECRVITHGQADGGALDLEVSTAFLPIASQNLVLLVMRDLRDTKRRRVLERVFFNDVRNTASSLFTAAQLMLEAVTDGDAGQIQALSHSSFRLAKRLTEEIAAQEHLLAAEEERLHLTLRPVSVADVLQEAGAWYRVHEPAWPCTVHVTTAPDGVLLTDPALLYHVLSLLVQNALEATTDGGTVTLAAHVETDLITFTVHNPAVMPDAVQQQLFQRSFSTKADTGRGIGTYSVKLLTERYLGGRVTYVSQEPEGTTFALMLPRDRAGIPVP